MKLLFQYCDAALQVIDVALHELCRAERIIHNRRKFVVQSREFIGDRGAPI